MSCGFRFFKPEGILALNFLRSIFPVEATVYLKVDASILDSEGSFKIITLSSSEEVCLNS